MTLLSYTKLVQSLRVDLLPIYIIFASMHNTSNRHIPISNQLTVHLHLSSRRPRVLLKVHTIPTRLLILDHLEVIRAQAKRLQDPVPQILQLPPHLPHLLLLRRLRPPWQLPELRPHRALVRGRETRQP